MSDTRVRSETAIEAQRERTLDTRPKAHGDHEKRAGQHDGSWPDWYAEYVVQEQAGKPAPS
jgi:hypothetical protein